MAIVDSLTLKEVEKATGVPAGTIKRLSSRSIIDKPSRVSCGNKGFRGHWSPRVVEQIKMVRQCTQSGKSLMYARGLVREKFGPQVEGESTFSEIGLRFMGAKMAFGTDTLNLADLLPDGLKKYPVELEEAARKKMPLFAMELENTTWRIIREKQRKLKQGEKKT